MTLLQEQRLSAKPTRRCQSVSDIACDTPNRILQLQCVQSSLARHRRLVFVAIE